MSRNNICCLKTQQRLVIFDYIKIPLVAELLYTELKKNSAKMITRPISRQIPVQINNKDNRTESTQQTFTNLK